MPPSRSIIRFILNGFPCGIAWPDLDGLPLELRLTLIHMTKKVVLY
jgi:hypothetical protein